MSLPLPTHLESLLEAARAGSSDALGQLFEALKPLLRVVAYRAKERQQVRPKISDSDLLQETFTTAFEKFEEFRGRSPEELLAWLERILQRLAANSVNHFRLAKRDVRREISLHDPHPQGLEREPVDARNESPLEVALRKEKNEAIRDALLRLPKEYRRVLELIYAEGKDVETIALQLGLSEAAVRKRQFRALYLCRDAFRQKPEPP